MERTQSDFVKHMASIDKKLQEARSNIAELKEGLNFTVQKDKTEAEESRSKPQTVNGEYAKWDGVVSTEWWQRGWYEGLVFMNSFYVPGKR